MASKKKRAYRGSSRKSKRARQFHESAAGPRQDVAAVIHCERRALLWATLGVFLGIFMWTICIGSEQWVRITAPGPGIYVNRTKSFFVRSNMGLFRMCRTTAPATTNGSLGPEEGWCWDYTVPGRVSDWSVYRYTRSEVAFCTISMTLLFMGLGFSVYTFKEPRYMFKRLAGGVHFLSAGVMVVVMEVESNSINYEEKYLSSRHPKGCRWSFGFSYYFSWITFCVYITAGLTFIVCSRKRKTLGDPHDDDPRMIGRI
ncbi:unnamed protein product [Ixodes hexagonus]